MSATVVRRHPTEEQLHAIAESDAAVIAFARQLEEAEAEIERGEVVWFDDVEDLIADLRS